MITGAMRATRQWRVRLSDLPEYSEVFDNLSDAVEFRAAREGSVNYSMRIETRTVMVVTVEESWISQS